MQEQLHVCEGGSKVVLAVARFERREVWSRCRSTCNFALAVEHFVLAVARLESREVWSRCRSICNFALVVARLEDEHCNCDSLLLAYFGQLAVDVDICFENIDDFCLHLCYQLEHSLLLCYQLSFESCYLDNFWGEI